MALGKGLDEHAWLQLSSAMEFVCDVVPASCSKLSFPCWCGIEGVGSGVEVEGEVIEVDSDFVARLPLKVVP